VAQVVLNDAKNPLIFSQIFRLCLPLILVQSRPVPTNGKLQSTHHGLEHALGPLGDLFDDGKWLADGNSVATSGLQVSHLTFSFCTLTLLLIFNFILDLSSKPLSFPTIPLGPMSSKLFISSLKI